LVIIKMETHSIEPVIARQVKSHFEKKLSECDRAEAEDQRTQLRVVNNQT